MNWDDILAEQEHLEHWGILGMKWGVRRYQNKDGSLTQAGRARYGSGSSKSLGERYSAYKKARTAKIKEKTMRSGNIKTILKNQKYLTDAEFDKAVARAKKVESLTPKESEYVKKLKESAVDSLTKERHLKESEFGKKIKDSIADSLTKERHLPEKKKKELDEYEKQKKQARTDAIVNERRMIDQVKQGIADKLSGRPKDKEQIDYQLAKQKIDKEKNTKLSNINLESVAKTAKKVAKYWATYTAVAAAVNKLTDKKTLPTSIGDIADKIKGLKGKDEKESNFYTTFVPSKTTSQNFSNITSYVSKQPMSSKVTSSDWVATGSSWFSSDSGKSATSTPVSSIKDTLSKSGHDTSSAKSFLGPIGLGSELKTSYSDILKASASSLSVPKTDWGSYALSKANEKYDKKVKKHKK